MRFGEIFEIDELIFDRFDLIEAVFANENLNILKLLLIFG
jgi:hypothetical protein